MNLKRAFLSASAAAVISLAAFATTADARQGGMGGGAHAGGTGGMHSGGGARMGGGGNFSAGARSGGFTGGARMGGMHNGGSFQNRGPAISHNYPGAGARHFNHRRHVRGPIVGFGGPAYYAYGYSDDDCYELRRVLTPSGWRRVWVNVCDY